MVIYVYATTDDYTSLGYEELDDKTEVYLERASRQINTICFGRIDGYGFDSLTNHQKKLIKEAVCAHAEFLYTYKEYLNMPVASFSVSKTSINFGDIGETLNGIKTSSQVIEFLKGTGLLCRVIR